MNCPKCNSNNIFLQVINESILKTKHRGIIWWLCIGWWFVPTMWIMFFVPKIIIKLFGLGHKRQKIVNRQKKVAICQVCGNTWDV